MSTGYRVRPLLAGEAEGPLLILTEPISFWGGVEPSTGVIVEQGHPQHGAIVRDKLLILPHGRGSSSASSVLAEMIRLSTSPAALILDSIDPILLLGAVVAEELYRRRMPVGVRTGSWPEIPAGAARARVDDEGRIEFD